MYHALKSAARVVSFWSSGIGRAQLRSNVMNGVRERHRADLFAGSQVFDRHAVVLYPPAFVHDSCKPCMERDFDLQADSGQ